jgi:tetratricopeptide (TPR) repeat protein
MDEAQRKHDAQTLHDEGVALADAGDKEAALAKYMAALALDLRRSDTLYNVGLYYKYQGAWAESFRFNKRSVEIDPGEEAANWNLAIAATALRDWATARECWARVGIKLPDGEGPIDANFGRTVVRLDPDGDGETVWGRRICPVRVRIDNIPFPDSGFAWQDVVLHDGAPMGYRRNAQGAEVPVFNVLELFEPSTFSTFVVEVEAAEPDDLAALERIAQAGGGDAEDWTASVRPICKACSEGRPHDAHDQDGGPPPWQTTRRIGVAAASEEAVEQWLNAWVGEGREVTECGLGLER